MSELEHEEEPALKVSDRRHFTVSGERRPNVDTRAFEAAPPLPQVANPKAEKPKEKMAPKPAPPPPPERIAKREITFSGLLQDLYATGMLQLGAELAPGRPGQLDLEGARETIDLMGMLQQKTQGNLDAQEQRLMEAALGDLRLAYVETVQAGNRVQPAVAVPPPPTARRR
ncbi:MAG: DUF1844 domain-containing protein [Terriglobales bacterium]